MYVCSVVFLFVLVMFGEVVCLFDWDVFVCFLDVSAGPVVFCAYPRCLGHSGILAHASCVDKCDTAMKTDTKKDIYHT